MGDVQGLSVQGVNYHRRKLSECNFLGATFLGGNCPGDICLGAIALGGNCLGGNCLEGNCPRWQLSRGDCPVPVNMEPSFGSCPNLAPLFLNRRELFSHLRCSESCDAN